MVGRVKQCGWRFRWTPAEDDRLRRLYPEAPQSDIESQFPSRTWHSIVRHASKLGIMRATKPRWSDQDLRTPLSKDLISARVSARLSLNDLSDIVGLSKSALSKAETSGHGMSLLSLYVVCSSLGVELRAVPIRGKAERLPKKLQPAPETRPLRQVKNDNVVRFEDYGQDDVARWSRKLSAGG